ncbi:IS110 family transposase [Bacillus swezeyi]|uniref:IS110 family transposase n=1 Tax=Bacillus swezeyi TaxID=1925020 RepID=UPI0039C5DDFF
MNPVVGIDVSKGESHVQAFLNKGTPFEKVLKVVHSKSGLDSFLVFIKKIEEKAGIRPTFILEATGHYHIPMQIFLEKQRYVVIVINPYVSNQSRKTSLRSVKTDIADAYHLAQLFYKEEFEAYKRRSEQHITLRHLTRQHESLTGMYTQVKMQFQSTLDQLFPAFHKLFYNIYSDVSLNTLEKYLSPQDVLSADKKQLCEDIYRAIKPVRSMKWASEKASKLITLAKSAPIQS